MLPLDHTGTSVCKPPSSLTDFTAVNKAGLLHRPSTYEGGSFRRETHATLQCFTTLHRPNATRTGSHVLERGGLPDAVADRELTSTSTPTSYRNRKYCKYGEWLALILLALM